MGKFDHLLIVSDLDGTFFGTQARILDNNLEAISYFKKNGGLFTIATGRDSVILKKILPEAKKLVSCPAILCNGSYLFDYQDNIFIDEVELDQTELLFAIDKVAEEFPEVGFRISSNIGFLCPRMSPFLMGRMINHLDITDQNPLSTHRDLRWHKCVYVSEPEISIKIERLLRSLPFEHSMITTSHATLCEVIPKSSGKGNKIKWLKEHFPDRKIICVGDNGNDLDMLQVADIAACPENAIDSVKKISSIHLCHHRDGCIADLIYKLDSSIKE